MMSRGQSEALIGMIHTVLDKAQLTPGDLDLFALTIGPGAFTGLRIGLAAAQGFCFAAGLRSVGVSVFEAVAYGVSDELRRGEPLLVALETKRADVYVQVFGDRYTPASEPSAMMPEEIPSLLPDGGIIVGDAVMRVKAAIVSSEHVYRFVENVGPPDAAHIAAIAAQRAHTATQDQVLRPLYLRAPDATLPAKKLGLAKS